MNTVAVQGVEREMARQRDRDEQPEPHASGRGASCAPTERTNTPATSASANTDKADNGVRVPAMVQQVADRRRRDARVREIDVREIRGDDAGADEQRALRLRAPGAPSARSARATPTRECVMLSTKLGVSD